MAWVFLLIAGIFEIGWPLGMKLSNSEGKFYPGWIAFAVISMALSGLFLYLAQKTIPMGTAYAVWTGIGAAGAFVAGILFFSDPAGFYRIASFTLIVLGIIGLKLSS